MCDRAARPFIMNDRIVIAAGAGEIPMPDATAAERVLVREPLPRELLARTGDSLLRIFAAAYEAEEVIKQFLGLPAVRAALEREHNKAAPSARPKSSTAGETSHACTTRLLSSPAGTWDRIVADWPASRRVGTFRHLIAVAEEHLHSNPERAHAITSFVLRQMTSAPPLRHAATLRELLSGQALLAHARALVALRAYSAALPVIAAAHAALRGSRAYEIERTHAQLLRARVLAAIGRDEEALDTLAVCALAAIEHADDCAVVDALAIMAVVLCTHGAFDLARPALILAEHIALENGHEHAIDALHSARTECAFLGYPQQARANAAEAQM